MYLSGKLYFTVYKLQKVLKPFQNINYTVLACQNIDYKVLEFEISAAGLLYTPFLLSMSFFDMSLAI